MNNRAALLYMMSEVGEAAGSPRVIDEDGKTRIVFTEGGDVEGPANDETVWDRALARTQENAYGYRELPEGPTRACLDYLTHPSNLSLMGQARSAYIEGEEPFRDFIAIALPPDMPTKDIMWEPVRLAVRTSHYYVLTKTRLAGLASMADRLTGQVCSALIANDRHNVSQRTRALVGVFDELREALNSLDDAASIASNAIDGYRATGHAGEQSS